MTVTIPNNFHDNLKIVIQFVYDKCGFELTNFKLSNESVQYGSCFFRLNENKIQHRVAKITPTKTGQFVTIWKRNKDGITEPFGSSDALDFIVITVKSSDNFGQFVFPKAILIDKEIITNKAKSGKRGIRVYPPWDIVTNKQAEKTQNWQTKYFLTIKKDNSTDLTLAKKLFAKAY